MSPPTPSERLDRRQFLALAAAMGGSAAWAAASPARSRYEPHERRDLYPSGVASGDPDTTSVLLWTRRPFSSGSRARLRVEIAEDEAFTRVIAHAKAWVLASSDWTCRVLVGNLQPSQLYWYRFIDAQDCASRVGRTRTAPLQNDERPVRFAFVSCQNINVGAQHAYRRMIFEDERAAPQEQLGFVLHQCDFIYEVVAYPEDNPNGLWGRPIRQVVRLPHGEKVGIFAGALHIPTNLEDYRTLYRAYLDDPDVQDARARWPFVAMWDNHEFSAGGWQSLQVFGGKDIPRQTRKVAALQAWFEYHPARIHKASGPSLEEFDPPPVQDVPVGQFDAHGLGIEPNNLRALASLTGYRTLHWGPHVDLILTDQHGYRSKDPARRTEAAAFKSDAFPELFPQEVMEILDAGREYAVGKPPATIRYADREIPNFRQNEPAQTILGLEQKAWFLQQLTRSRATWKIWSCTLGTLEYRVDAQNFPAGLTTPWPGAGYATCANRDHSTAYVERAEIYTHVRNHDITGFVTVCGDRHSFWAGLAAPALPPQPFEPVGVTFIAGSLSAPGMIQMQEASLSASHPLRAFYLAERSADSQPQPILNLLFRHGVQSSLEYQRTGDIVRARSLSNPQLAPHLSFLDLDGHGYATVLASSKALECEFVCIPRPIERSTEPDGGPIRYRVVHRTRLWKAGEIPQLEQVIVAGNPILSL
jgi:alkaline phosphatase D